MDRLLVYPFEQLEDIDLLNSERNTIIALGNVLDSIIGEDFTCNNLTCTQSAVPDMNVNLSPSMLTQLLTVDPVAYGSIGIDTTPLVKQGINFDPVVIPLTAPATPGYAISYLIQAQVNEADTDSTSRGFFNGTPPPTTQTVAQRRADTITFQAKAGTAAPIGTQVTPSPDAGFCGCFTIAVAEGQTTIVNSNIARYTFGGAVTFLDEKLQDKISVATGNTLYILQADSTNFRAYLNSAQTITNNTWTKVLFDTVSYDNKSIVDTANSKIIPNVPGYYSLSTAISVDFAGATGGTGIETAFYFNGSPVTIASALGTGSDDVSGRANDTILFNGTTDYLEVWVRIQSTVITVPLNNLATSTYISGFRTP